MALVRILNPLTGQTRKRSAYWLYPQHPGNLWINTGEPTVSAPVPADEVLHVYELQRTQTRGVPWGTPAIENLQLLADYELAEITHVDLILYYGDGDDGTGLATSIIKIGGAGPFVLATLLGAANGVATLDSSGKLPASQLTAAVVGAPNYQGTWNAATNSPSLASGTKGFLYKVATAGTTALDGHATWNVGDVAVFNGATWDKLDGIDSEVLSVAGRAGAVTLTTADLADTTTVGRALATAASVAAVRVTLGIEGLTTVADANYTALPTDQRVEVIAARTITLPAANAVNAGKRLVVGDTSGALSSAVNLAGAADAFLMWNKPTGIVSRRQAERDQAALFAYGAAYARRGDHAPVKAPAGSAASKVDANEPPKPAIPAHEPAAKPAPSGGLSSVHTATRRAGGPGAPNTGAHR